MAAKGNKVKLATFLSWGKENIIGKKTEVDPIDHTEYVTFVWCLVCCRRAYEIYSEKRRKVAFEDKVNFETGIQEPPLKKTRLDASECETSSSDTDDGSSESDARQIE